MKRKLFYLKLMFLTLWSVQMNAQEVLDQQHTAANFETIYNDGGSEGINVEAVYQTFTATESGKLTKLELGLKTLIGTATVSITATDLSGIPTGPNLVSRSVSSVGETATVIFTNPITISAGTKYAIKIVKLTEHRIKRDSTNSYANGDLYIKIPNEAIYTDLQDINFKTYVDLQLQDNATLTHFTSCAESPNGSITLAPTGGVAPYIYSWTSTVSGFTNPGNVSIISNLLPGTYTCNIKDSRTPISRDKTYIYYINDENPIKRDAYVINNSPTCGNHSVTISPLASIIYKNSFETSDGITLSGDAVRETSNQIKLVPDENNKNGKVIINNLPATLPSNFEVNWRFFHKQKDGADGYSFNLGNDSFPGSNEDGTNQGLAVKFKIYQQDQVSIKWNGTEIVAPVNTTLELGKWIDAKLTVVAGKITLYVNGQQIANNVTITGFTQNNAYKIIFAARTGGASNESIIDDVTFGDFSAFEYSIDGTTYQTSNVFSNIILPADRVVPIWLKQNGCARKFTDYIYPVNGDISQLDITSNSNCNQGTISISDVFDPSTAPVNRTFIFGATLGNKAGYNIHKGTTEILGSGFLLTKDAQDNKGYYSFSKPEGFSKNFELNVVHSSLNKSGAEGFSINLGNLSALENETVNYENGVSSGLAIRFKTNNTDNVSMFYNNVQIGTTVSPGDLETGGANNIKIEVKGTTIKTYLNETEILTGTLPASYTTDDFANYKFAIAARTSGAFNENLIQNVQLFSLEQLQYSKDNVTFTDLTTPGVTTQTEIPFVSSDIVNNKVKIYFKFKNGCKLTNPKELVIFKSAAAPAGSSTQNYTFDITKFQNLTITTDPGYVLRWYTSSADATSGTFASGLAPTELIPIPSSTIVYAVAFPIGNTTCRSPYTEVTLTAVTPSSIVLTQIGNEGDEANTVSSVVTAAQLGLIEPVITGIVAANEAAYQAYIDANPDLFASPATVAEVQAMVNAVNSNAVLTQIGNEGDAPNTVTSAVTTAQLGQIVPAITGIVAANQTAYQAYIDANPALFSSPATAAEVQAMVTAVNSQVAAQAVSNAVLTQIGNEGDSPNIVTSVVTVAQLGQIIPAITGIVAANQAAYQAYIDGYPIMFSAPATAAEVQAMVTAVNAQVAAQAASNAVLTQIGNEGDTPNTVTSIVTVAQLGQIIPTITGVVAANQAAYQSYIDANPALFASPATAAEVQAMVTAVNAQVAAQASSNAVLTQIGNEGDAPNTVTSSVTVAQLGVIIPAITGIENANQSDYQAYIDANPDMFSSPATAAEVQAMVTTVNAQAAAQTTTFNYMPSTNPALTFTAYGQIQSYLIPPGVTKVKITAAGATSTYNNNAAIVTAEYNVTPGMYLNILAAGKGFDASGGGGTFITYEAENRSGDADFSTANNVSNLILAAGGAGSLNAASTTLASNPASLTANNGGGTYGGIAGGNGGVNPTDLFPASTPPRYGGYGGGGAYGFSGGSGGAGFGGTGGIASTTTYGGGGGFSGGTNFIGGTSWISNSELGIISGTQIGAVTNTLVSGNGYVKIQINSISLVILAQIGNEGDAPNTVTSVVTVAQLGQILPAITGIVAANQTAYQAYIDANPTLFASPATAAEVQAMVTAVNAQVAAQAASNAVLTQIGNEGDAPNTVTSVVTVAQLGQILPAITGIVAANQAAYQAYIDANPTMFSAPATAAEVQAMVTAVNAQVAAQAASNAVLTQIGNEGDAPNTVTSVVTVAQLGQILPAITGIVAANESAYQAYIDANPTMFSAPATAAEVQAMVNTVNVSLSTTSFDIQTIVVYPNPSIAIFNIVTDTNATFELYDLTGKSLKSDAITVGTTRLDLSNYANGVYLLNITNELNQSKIVRIIKQ